MLPPQRVLLEATYNSLKDPLEISHLKQAIAHKLHKNYP